MKKNKKSNITKLIKQHILNNSKEYIIFCVVFLIGIFLGVLFTNNIKEEQYAEVTTYFGTFIEKMKNIDSINSIELVKSNIMQNILLATLLWFFGTTVIGLPAVFGIITYRGFCLGYTISVIINVFGVAKGISFILISLVLQNIIFIPAILAIAVSGFKLYKSIIKDKRKENIKLELLRHTIFCLIMLILLIISAGIEIFVSSNILKNLIKYF